VAKLAPDYSSLTHVAKTVEAAGADAILMINAPRALCIDYCTGKPIIRHPIGSLAGTAIKTLAGCIVLGAVGAVQNPHLGMGGVADFKDVIEFMAAGARSVAFGTINYVDPMALPCALADLTAYLEENNIPDVNDLVGIAHREAGAELKLPETVA